MRLPLRLLREIFLAIHLDPVVSDFWCDARAVVSGDDDVGSFIRHMAIDALADDRASAFWEKTTALDLMTRQTFLGKVSHIALSHVSVVTSRTRHC